MGLKPSNTLTPSNSLVPSTGYPEQNIIYPKKRILRFENTTTNEIIDYELPEDLLYYNNNNYDEFTLNYGDGTPLTKICQVTKKCKYNADGTIGLLTTPETHTYTYPSIQLTDGDYTISILSYNSGYIFARLMAKNIYTTQFYTKAETNSIINQTASDITLGVSQTLSNYSTTNEMNSAINIKANEINQTVSQKVGNNEIISKINQTPEQITINANKLNLQGYITASDLSGTGTTTINGSNITTGSINADRISGGTISGNDVNITNLNASNITTGTISANKISGGTINANNISVTNLTASNINRGLLSGIPYSYSTSSNGNVKLGDNSDGPIMGYRGTSPRWSIASFTTGGRFQTFDSNGNMASYLNQTGVHTSSDIRYKKNIENIEEKESLNIIKNLTPISYDYDTEQRHRGLSAQEVERILNDNEINKQIYEIDKNGRYSLNYIELIPDLINCIKYLSEKVEKLERESDK